MSERLDQHELARYSRQIALSQVGLEGQQRLRNARVVVVGAGGLGAPVSLYLAAAGVGTLTLVDGDRVELSNLQRQVLFQTADVGRYKAEVSADRLRALNDTVAINVVSEHLSLDNVETLLQPADLVLDCCDNFPTRYLINDFCRHLGKPWLFAAVHQFRGHLALFTPDTACFRCLYPETPITEGNCSLAGVMGTVPGLMGLWQANEAIKFLLKLPESQPGQLWLCDVLNTEVKRIRLSADPDCICGPTGFPDPYWQHSRAGNPEDDGPLGRSMELTWAEWQRLVHGEREYVLIDIRGDEEHAQANAGGCCIPQASAVQRIPAEYGNAIVGLYCQTGRRSLALAYRLRGEGMSNVFSLAGGVESLQRREKPPSREG